MCRRRGGRPAAVAVSWETGTPLPGPSPLPSSSLPLTPPSPPHLRLSTPEPAHLLWGPRVLPVCFEDVLTVLEYFVFQWVASSSCFPFLVIWKMIFIWFGGLVDCQVLWLLGLIDYFLVSIFRVGLFCCLGWWCDSFSCLLDVLVDC